MSIIASFVFGMFTGLTVGILTGSVLAGITSSIAAYSLTALFIAGVNAINITIARTAQAIKK